jgi:NAD(P)-dependent dehydrogenase (short-subunit alcohol dehydrogenase family)
LDGIAAVFNDAGLARAMAERVLVTGASSGIGEAAVERLLSEGFEVWATARSAEDRDRLDDRGARSIGLDLREPREIQTLAAEVGSEPLDGLVHNAGIGVPGAVEDLDREAWLEQLEVNVVGPATLTRALAGALRDAEGRVVMVSSLAARTHVPFYGAYCASKAALEAAGDTLRAEMGPAGVDVSLVQPGPVATAFQARSRELLAEHVDVEESPHRESYERVAEAILERLPAVTADDVAAAIEECLTARRAPTRVAVGRLASLGTRALGWLPDRTQDRILRWLFVD